VAQEVKSEDVNVKKMVVLLNQYLTKQINKVTFRKIKLEWNQRERVEL
jgi:hypothetical protein